MQGGEFTFLNIRLQGLGTTPEDMVYLLNLCLICMLCFVVSYVALSRDSDRNVEIIRGYAGWPIITASIFVILVNAWISIFFGSFSVIPQADGYVDTYLVVANLPLGVKQVSKIFSGFDFVAFVVLSFALFQNYSKNKLLIFITLSVYIFLNIGGSRSGIIFYLFSQIVLWHLYVKPITLFRFVTFGTFSLLAFMAVGIIRSVGIGDFAITGVGEFSLVWGNAVELLHEKNTNEIDMPLSVRFADFYGFIPSQFLWFEKSVPSIWFMQNFYPIQLEQGHGFAFGIFSEFIVGNGIIDAALRGTILGGISALLMRFFRRKHLSWWALPLQLLFLVFLVNSIRDTSFRLIVDVFQIYLPGLILIFLISRIVSIPLINYKGKRT